MTDFMGNKLNVGDEVVFLQHYDTSSHLYKGRIHKITPKMVVLENGRKKDPGKVVKIQNNMAILPDPTKAPEV